MSTFVRLADWRGLRWIAALVLLAQLLLLAGCASIMHGTTQQVAVSSSPTGAQVTVDAMERGVTPVIADLKRKDNHVVRVTMDGYQPFEMALTRSVSGWVWGNIVFGGLIGLAVDAITGGLYKIAPEQVTADLKADGAALQVAEGGEVLLVTVVLRPTAGMERIGTLAPEAGR
jgi:uncharacterized protein YceK